MLTIVSIKNLKHLACLFWSSRHLRRARMPAYVVEEFRDCSGFSRAAADGIDGVKSECSVTFHLRFAEPLVAGWFVGEVGMGSRIVGDISWFQTAERGLDVKQSAVGAGAVDLGVLDCSKCIIAELGAFLLRRDGLD